MECSDIIEKLKSFKTNRNSYHIAKELLMIELNLIWKDDYEFIHHRLCSLARYVRDTLGTNPEALEIAEDLENFVTSVDNLKGH